MGAAHFSRWNRNLEQDQRTQTLVADGRHFLAGTERDWDLVTADPIHPWTAGSSDLYALEHFKNMERHLATGGIASQWLPLYQLAEADVRTVIATWCAAFKHTSAWLTAYDLVLVGAAQPLPGPTQIASHPLPPAVAEALAEVGIHGPAELAALCVAEDGDLRAYAEGVDPMRDNRPVLEFRAPRSYLGGYSTKSLLWAARVEFLEKLPEGSRERGMEIRSALTRFLGRLPEGWSSAARRYGDELLALPPI